MIVCCRSLNLCAELFCFFHFNLGEDSYFPAGASHISKNRIFAMYHFNTTQHIKKTVIESLGVPDGVVRVVFATIALGVGVDLK